ncbi:MAG: D-alanyl-D-alanine carboxypeptidase/D-alanyl-D-alanine-endopeptidase [Planctomycetes bacterium]|nr:D-alanyl-D-alanine carboxypeptidase/D-alanyl-D-alanine-endopeptidase [Planctomycetota bacterium]
MTASHAGGVARTACFLILALLLPLCFACSEEPQRPDAYGDQAAAAESARPRPRPLPDEAIRGFARQAERAVERLGKGAAVSALVVDLGTGDLLFAHEADRALVPASNMKLLTGGVFLAVFGPEHQLSTRFVADGEIDGAGRLDGDLIVVGGGDPSLSRSLFGDDPEQAIDAIAAKLESRGLRAVSGRLLADGRLFSGPATGPNWPNDGPESRYLAEVSALVYNDNRCQIECRVEEGRSRVGVRPDVGYVSVTDRLDLAERQNIVVSRGRDDNRFTVSGSIVARSTYDADVSIHDGDLYYVTALARALETRGIEVGGVGRVEPDRVLPERPALLDFVARARRSLTTMLTESQNLYAELFFRLIGAELVGEGSFGGGSRALSGWLEQRGILAADSVIADGSGLSRDNRLSAAQIVALLDLMQRDRAAEAFRGALAQPGHDGTLHGRMKSLDGRLFAKTGTLNQTSALSGYLQIGPDRWAAFSILCNDCLVGRARSVQDEICQALALIEP